MNGHLVYLKLSAGSYLYGSNVWFRFSELMNERQQKIGTERNSSGGTAGVSAFCS
jgi:hypothetical protein